MSLGHRAAEPHEQTSSESRFARNPEEPMRLSVSFPRRTMVEVFDSNNSIKEKERREYDGHVQHNEHDPDVGHSIKEETQRLS